MSTHARTHLCRRPLSRSLRLPWAAVAAVALLSACSKGGFVQDFTADGGGGADGTGGNGGGGDKAKNKGGAVDHLPAARACVAQGTPAPRNLRRLSAAELNATIADLFGKDSMAPHSETVFAGDPVLYGFRAIADGMVVSAGDASALRQLAEAAGALAAQKLTLVASCASADDACRKQAVEGFGARAFRRPLTEAESSAYQKLMAQGGDFPGQVATLVAAMLQSPKFLYRSEMGSKGADGTYALTPYEIASELSYLTVGSMPDEALTKAAADGSLARADVLHGQATRLLADPRAHTVVDQFFMQWLGLAQFATATRMEGMEMLDQQTRLDMLEEARRMVDALAFDGKSTFASLFGGTETFVNDNLAKVYGLAGGGGDFKAVSIGERGAGVLGLGGVLAANSANSYASPTLRGRMLRMRMLCDSLGSPPPNVPALTPEQPNQSVRQRFAAHAADPTCASCHRLMDPLAFPMGEFDAMGRARKDHLDNGQKVETDGEAFAADGSASTPLPGGFADLNKFLATSPKAQACMTRHMVMYGLGQLSWAQDSCTFDAAAKPAAASGTTLLQAYLAVLDTPAFTKRTMDE